MPDSAALMPIEHGRHYEVIKRAIPQWLIDASAEERAALRQTKPRIPDWYASASQAQKDHLKSLVEARVLALKNQRKYMDTIPALNDYAQRLLEDALKKIGFTLSVNHVFIRLYAPTEDAFGVGSGAFTVKTLSLLQAALHNFEQPETQAGYFANGSGFITEPDSLGRFEPYKTELAIATFTSLCRTLDIGRLYQEELKDYLFPDSPVSQQILRGRYIKHQKAVLEVDAQIALLKGDIDASAHSLMMRVIKGERQIRVGEDQLWYRYLCVMGLELKGCVVFDVSFENQFSDAKIVWIPGDPEHPLKQYANYVDFRDELTRQLTARTTTLRQTELTPYQQFLSRFIRHQDRPYYYRRLTMLIKDAPDRPAWFEWGVSFVPLVSLALSVLPKWDPHTRRVLADQPDIDVQICIMSDDSWDDVEIWGKLYADMRGRMLNNARSMALPTAQADANNRSLRMAHYLNIGMFAVNLVAMAVPPLGDVMLVVMVGQLLYETVEGFIEWSEGDKEAAWGHINDVLQNLTMLAAGAVVIKGGVSPLIEKLKAVTLPSGQMRLWQADLAPYEHSISFDPHSKPNEVGLHTHNQQRVLLHEGKHYVLQKDPVSEHYRALHATNPDAWQPEFRHNGDGVWVHEGEEPLTWQRPTLMRRLGTSVQGLSDEQLGQILQASGVHEDLLRRLYVENEPTPAMLVETLHTFKSYAKVKATIAQVRSGRVSADMSSFVAAFSVELAGWPSSKAIEIFDPPTPRNPQAIAGRFGSAQATGTDIIKISRQDMINGELPGRVVDALTRDQLEGLLGSHLPVARDERLQAFRQQLSTLMEENTQRLFSSVYEKHLLSDDPLREGTEWLQRIFPKLPTSVAYRLAAQASPAELAQLTSGKGPARLMKIARTLQREARLAGAYQGLYMDELATPDTETLVLNTLEKLPGWEDDLLLEVRDGHYRGELRASFGPESASRHKVLVRVGAGRYQARDERDIHLHGTDNLYNSLQHALPDWHRGNVDLPHVGQGESLQLSIQQHALPRDELARLLKLRPESRPFFFAPERLPDGRLGYPLSGRGTGTRQPQLLIDRLRDLFPMATAEQLTDFFLTFKEGASAKIIEFEDDLIRLRLALSGWIISPIDGAPLNRPLTQAQKSVVADRRYISHCLKQAWHRAGLSYRDGAGQYVGEALVIEGAGLGAALETLPALTSNLAHIKQIKLTGIGATDAIDRFLSNFPSLRSLEMSSNRLTRLPSAIARMTRLEILDLADNNITLPPESVGQLKNLTRLKLLSMDNSPLGLPPDLSRMPYLYGVYLNGCGLDRWPTGLLAHSRRRSFRMALARNPLTQIPEVAPGSDRAGTLARTSFSRDMVSPAVEHTIELYRESVGIEPGRRELPGMEVESRNWIEGLPAAEGTAKQALWNRVELEEGSESFFEVISDQARHLSSRSAAFKKDMQAKLWRMLLAMDESPELRSKIFEMAEAPFTCVDAGAQLFNALGVEVMWYETYQAPREWMVRLEVFELARGKARLDELGRIARARVRELEAQGRRHPEYTAEGERVDHYDANGVLLIDIDEVEIYLKFTTELASRLELPWQSPGMMFAEPDVTPSMLEYAYERVLALEQGDGLRNQLLDQPRWLEFIQGAYRSNFEEVRAKIDALTELQAAQRAWVDGVDLAPEQKADLRTQIVQAASVLGKPASAVSPGVVMSDAAYDADLLTLGAQQQRLLQTLTDEALNIIPLPKV